MRTALKIAGMLAAVLAIVALWGWYHLRKDFAEPHLSGTLHHATVMVSGLERSFAFYQPLKPKAQPALVFALHGSGGDGLQIRKGSHYQFDVLADREGFVVVYPDGYKRYWNDCRRSGDWASNTENIDDPAFFRAMIDGLVQRLNADPHQVFAFGQSNGGHMVYRLALEMPEAFAGLAAVSASMPVPENLDCTPRNEPVSIAIVNGTNDPINPFGGGDVKILGNSSRGRVLSTAASAAYWANLAGAAEIPVSTYLPETDGDPRTRIKREIWRNQTGIQVRLYTLEGSGHVLPSRASSLFENLFGGGAGDIDAAPELWDFFVEAHGSARPRG